MSSGWLIFLIAVGVVAFFVVGMSLTIIFKGHYMAVSYTHLTLPTTERV